MNEQEFKGTPGPWRWEVNLRHKDIQLCGGRRLYDLTVMDFKRFGMQGAQPRFNIADCPEMNLMHDGSTLVEVVKGREHHSQWFQTINHPDACLIAAAPDLLEACLQLVNQMPISMQSLTAYQSGISAINKALNNSAHE